MQAQDSPSFLQVSSSLQGVQLILGWYGLTALSFVMPLTKQEQSKNLQATGDLVNILSLQAIWAG